MNETAPRAGRDPPIICLPGPCMPEKTLHPDTGPRRGNRSAAYAPVRPAALPAGGLIGVAAPAGPFDRDRFQRGLSRLRLLGFDTLYPETIFQQSGFLAGRDRERAEVFNSMWTNDEVGLVIGARGGYGSMRILDQIDYDRIEAIPKAVLGFSDLTALLLAIHHRTGLVTFHGPMVTSLAEADDATVAHLARLLAGKPVFPIEIQPEHFIRPGHAQGPLLGGNLTMIIHLLSTSWLPDLSGAILFLEDVGEAPYRLDRMFTTLRLAGILDRIHGLILGSFQNCGTEEEIRDVIEQNLIDFSGPVVWGFPIGHGQRNLALPIGPRAVLDARAGLLDVIEPYLV